jgi:hypothetical protein
LAQQAASYLSSELKTEIRIDKVDIVFFDRIDIEGVYIEDKTKDTLLYSEQINLKIDNGVPQQPASVPPQATLSDSEYTPAQARALV